MRFIAASLGNPAETHGLLVSEPKIGGRADRLLLKFGKPA